LDVFGKSRKYRSHHRAVAEVIATLFLVAIAVIGGTIIFVFSQEFFNQAQISGTPTIESVKILGYDARDVALLDAHDGQQMTATASVPTNPGKTVGEYVVVYIKNDSSGQVLFSEIRLGGAVYDYEFPGPVPDHTVATIGNYVVMNNSTHTILDQAGVAQPGETIGILFDLSDNFPIGRDTQFKLTTTNGAVFVGTVIMGQNAG